MDVQTFILKDLEKLPTVRRRKLLLGGILTLAALGFGLGLRPDALGLEDPLYWVLAIPLVLMAGLLPVLYGAEPQSEYRRWKLFWLVVGTVVLMSGRPGSFTFEYKYATNAELWEETGRCFLHGAVASLFALAVVLVSALKLLPLPNDRWVKAACVMPGVVGLAMLNVHCPADDLTHLFFSHWLPGGVLAFVMYGLTRWLLRRLVGRVYAGTSRGDPYSLFKA